MKEGGKLCRKDNSLACETSNLDIPRSSGGAVHRGHLLQAYYLPVQASCVVLHRHCLFESSALPIVQHTALAERINDFSKDTYLGRAEL